MEDARHSDRLRPGADLARAQISIIGQDHIPLLVIYRKRILCVRMGKVIERRINPRYDEKKADAQET